MRTLWRRWGCMPRWDALFEVWWWLILNYFLCLHSIILLAAVDPPVELMANCTLGDVRLVNGSSQLEGRVEVCFGNLWGTICHNSWDNRDAGVICKQLFNPFFGKLLCECIFKFHPSLTLKFWLPLVGGHAINGSKYGPGGMPVVIDSINCKGTEGVLTDCPITSYAINTCNDSTTAGIVCYGK